MIKCTESYSYSEIRIESKGKKGKKIDHDVCMENVSQSVSQSLVNHTVLDYRKIFFFKFEF